MGTVAREDVEIDGAENGIRSIHFNNHGNPEKVVQSKGRRQVSYLSTPLNGAGCTCVKLFGGEAKRQPLLASSESTAGASYENFLRERLGETGCKTWYSQNMAFHCLSNVCRHNLIMGLIFTVTKAMILAIRSLDSALEQVLL